MANRQIAFCRLLRAVYRKVAVQLLEEFQNPEVDLQRTARILSQDPALSAKTLSFVNSPLYGVGREVTNISHATMLIGLHSVRALALSFSLVNTMKKHSRPGFDCDSYWKRSIVTAAAARSLAKTKYDLDYEMVFMAGLLKGIGILTPNSLFRLVPISVFSWLLPSLGGRCCNIAV